MDTGGRSAVAAAVIGAAGVIVAALISVGRLFPPQPNQSASPESPRVTVSPSLSKSPSPSPSPATKAMVNLVGKYAGAAKRILLDAGFTEAIFVGDDGKPFDPLKAPSDNAFQVVQQSPSAGTRVPLNSRIVVTCRRVVIG